MSESVDEDGWIGPTPTITSSYSVTEPPSISIDMVILSRRNQQFQIRQELLALSNPTTTVKYMYQLDPSNVKYTDAQRAAILKAKASKNFREKVKSELHKARAISKVKYTK